MDEQTQNEIHLLQQIIEGDTLAFREFYELYQGKIFLFAYRLTKSKHDAEEIVQEVFVKLWEKREQIKIEKNIQGYIFQMTRNMILNGFRKAAIDKKVQQKIYDNMQALRSPTVDGMFHKELERLHQLAIKKLAPQQRKIYLLSREEELSYEKIAEKLSISKNTVRNTMINSLRSIREDLSNHHDLNCLIMAIILQGIQK
ncbi:MAG: RNA polymerase sigma-70 factor [Chitinophagaceae bacterium]